MEATAGIGLDGYSLLKYDQIPHCELGFRLSDYHSPVLDSYLYGIAVLKLEDSGYGDGYRHSQGVAHLSDFNLYR